MEAGDEDYGYPKMCIRDRARDVQEKVARSDDDAVADRLKSYWVRIAPPADRD